MHVSMMLLKTQEEVSDKRYEIELSWITKDTNYTH